MPSLEALGLAELTPDVNAEHTIRMPSRAFEAEQAILSNSVQTSDPSSAPVGRREPVEGRARICSSNTPCPGSNTISIIRE